MYTQKKVLSHTTPKLIPIRAGVDHKGSKALPHNTAAFLKLELETSIIVSPIGDKEDFSCTRRGRHGRS